MLQTFPSQPANSTFRGLASLAKLEAQMRGALQLFSTFGSNSPSEAFLPGAKPDTSVFSVDARWKAVIPMTFAQSNPSTSSRSDGSASDNQPSSHVPALSLNREGTIEHLTEPARRALEYCADTLPTGHCFFSHVHGRNLRRVMRDLALMVGHRKQRARWLLRLRTGSGRWRWFRAEAHNHLDQSEGLVQLYLRPL